MKSIIKVEYQLATNPDQTIRVPVRYKVVDDQKHCIKTVFCQVDLPEDAIPAWLNPVAFTMVNHYKAGLHIINYNDKEVNNMDAEFFRYKLYADIMLVERLKDGKQMEHC